MAYAVCKVATTTRRAPPGPAHTPAARGPRLSATQSPYTHPKPGQAQPGHARPTPFRTTRHGGPSSAQPFLLQRTIEVPTLAQRYKQRQSFVRDQVMSTIEVFYSYSHKDEALRDELNKHLALLKRQGVIRDWHDRRITAGTEWSGQMTST